MSWFHVNDQAYGHEKFMAADEAGIGAWTKLGSWSAERLTDGVIPGVVARKLCSRRGLAEAVKARILVRDETTDTYTISGYLDCNPSAERVRARRAGDLSRQDRHRGHVPVTRDKQRDHGVTGASPGPPVTRDTSRARLATPAPAPAPAPDPPLVPPGGETPEGGEGEQLQIGGAPAGRRKRRKAETALATDWMPPRDLVTWAQGTLGFDEARVVVELGEFRLYAAEHDRRAADWTAAFRRWLGKAKTFVSPLARAVRPPVQPPPAGGSIYASEVE